MRVRKNDYKNPQKIYWTVSLDELKKQLMVENIKSYANYAEFKRKVLEVAKNEVKELTDIEFKFESITKGRKVEKIKFEINTKNIMDRYKADRKNNELLGDNF